MSDEDEELIFQLGWLDEQIEDLKEMISNQSEESQKKKLQSHLQYSLKERERLVENITNDDSLLSDNIH